MSQTTTTTTPSRRGRVSLSARPRGRARPGGRAALLLLAAAAAGSVAGCGPEPIPPDVPGAVRAIDNPGFARQWATTLSLAAGDEVTFTFVRGDWLFVYTRQGTAYALRREDGRPAFAAVVAGGAYRMFPPVLLRSQVVFPTTNTLEVYSYAGVFERSLDVGAAIRADCVGDRSDVFVPVDSPDVGAVIKRYDLSLAAVNVPRWQLQAWQGGIAAAPALHAEIVYLAADVGTVYAVAAENREPIWPLPGNTFDARSRVVAPLRADDAGLYVSTVEGKLYCLHRTTGVVKWQYFAGGSLEAGPVVLADTVYVPDPARGWTAVDKVENPDVKDPQYNRAPRWSNNDVAEVLSQDDRYTYVRTTGNRLAGLDKRTGRQRFASARADFHVFATNPRDATVYAAGRAGRVVAVRAVLQPGQTGEVVMLDQDKAPEAAVAAAAAGSAGGVR